MIGGGKRIGGKGLNMGTKHQSTPNAVQTISQLSCSVYSWNLHDTTMQNFLN